MIKLQKIFKSDYKRNLFLLIALNICISFHSLSQKISIQLDSINKLDISNEDKILLYHSLIDKYEKLKNYTQLGHDSHQIAKWLHKTNKKESKEFAYKFINKAIQSRKRANPFDPDLLKRSLNNKGLYFFLDREYYKAIETYKELLSIPETNYLIGRTYSKIGECYQLLEEPFLAIDNYKKAFKYLQDDNNSSYLINNYIKLANTQKLIRTSQSAKDALINLDKAENLLLISQKQNFQKLYTIYNNIGSIYYDILVDTTKAQFYYEKALKEARKLNIKEYTSITSYNLALSYIKKNNNKAIYYFQQAFENAENNINLIRSIYIGYGLLENSNKNYDQASEFYFMSISSFLNKKVTLENIEKVLVNTTLDSINNKMLFLEVFKDAIDNYIDQGSKQNEDIFYKKAIKLVRCSDKIIDNILRENKTENTKLLWRSIASGTYASGIEASYELDDIEYAFYLSEKNKALLLSQEILRDKLKIPKTVIQEEYRLKSEVVKNDNFYREEQDTIKKRIAFDRLYTAKQHLLDYKDSIVKIHPSYHLISSIPKITELNNVNINGEEIILQYMMTERVNGLYPNTYCLVIANGSKKIFKLDNSKILQDKIVELRQILQYPFKFNNDINSYIEKSYELYKSLIPISIRAELIDKKVTIIPDHLINTVPFESLITNPKTGQYLIENSEISYKYSISFEEHNLKRERTFENEFLGVAPVNFNNFNLISLPKSKDEINIGLNYYSGKKMIQKNATKENFMKDVSEYKIVHLATHAFASDSISPWIAFRNDKMLNSEIDLTSNNAELVYLSACQSMIGEVYSGEGVMSLARSFFKSGAKTVISTLWNTNDKATAEITKDFYKNLSKGATKSEALHKAKLNYLKNHSGAEASPHYWASLVLIGDTGQLLPANNFWLLFMVFLSVLLGLIYILYLLKRKKNSRNSN